MKRRIEITIQGLKCDNPKCDFRDDTIKMEDYPKWLNKPCEKCGENLLTEEDFRNSERLLAIGHYINSMSDEDYELMSDTPDIKALKESGMFKDAEGLENLIGDGDNKVGVIFDTHKEIKANKIIKLED